MTMFFFSPDFAIIPLTELTVYFGMYFSSGVNGGVNIRYANSYNICFINVIIVNAKL